jgi:class 3 adenylate cyclase
MRDWWSSTAMTACGSPVTRDAVIDEVEQFLTGQRGTHPSNRVLSTVLLTDIVESTQCATQLSDAAWTAVLAAHDHIVERHVTAWRGNVAKFTGDVRRVGTGDRMCACNPRCGERSRYTDPRRIAHW